MVMTILYLALDWGKPVPRYTYMLAAWRKIATASKHKVVIVQACSWKLACALEAAFKKQDVKEINMVLIDSNGGRMDVPYPNGSCCLRVGDLVVPSPMYPPFCVSVLSHVFGCGRAIQAFAPLRSRLAASSSIYWAASNLLATNNHDQLQEAARQLSQVMGMRNGHMYAYSTLGDFALDILPIMRKWAKLQWSRYLAAGVVVSAMSGAVSGLLFRSKSRTILQYATICAASFVATAAISGIITPPSRATGYSFYVKNRCVQSLTACTSISFLKRHMPPLRLSCTY